MFSRFFINRPIFSVVIAVVMVIAGLVALAGLPVTQYPDITPLTVMVSAEYPGANAVTVARSVGTPIEQQINGTEGMLYMSSTSGNDGSYNLTVTFENGTDIDQAAIDVQNRLNLAQSQLPTSVTEQGVNVRKQSSDHVLFIALESDDPARYDALYLTNYANLHITDPLSRVEGVGDVGAFGSGNYSMRVWLNPELMRVRGLTPQDVAAAIRAQNMEVSSGAVGQRPSADTDFSYTLDVNGRLSDVEQFENIVLRSDGSNILRLGDVARVELGSTSYSGVALVNGRELAMIGVSQLPGSNAMDVAKAALKELDNLSDYFPDGVSYRVIQNSTDFVKASLDDLMVTFLETTLIVMLVILLFLQNWRAVVIPMLTIPVSLIATLAVMRLMGFSLNTLTLFGLVLAIAIVVDDAIVVVEDCSRLVDKGELTRHQAAEKAMTELTGPVVGEVLVLLSVFVPTAFVSGITGELYKQFALTIAVSTAFSGFNALTLTPALCALFLTPRKESKFFIYRWFDKGWAWVSEKYSALLALMLRHSGWSMGVFLLLAAAGAGGFVKWPTSYIPSEDMGYFMTSVQLPSDASLDRTEQVVRDMAVDIKREVPHVKDVISFAGMSLFGGNGSNVGSLMVVLDPWKERRGKKNSVDALMRQTDGITARYQEAMAFSVNPPSIPGLGMSSGLEMQLLNVNSLSADEMTKALASLREAAAHDDRIASVTSTYMGTQPQYSLQFNKDRILMMGVDIEDVYSTLSAYTGGSLVNDFNKFGRTYHVELEGDAMARKVADDVLRLSVRNSAGEMVPLSAFTTVQETMGEPSVNRYNMYGSLALTANPAKGVSSSDGIKAMEELTDNTLGKNFGYAWTGEAYQETQAGTTVSIVFIFAIIMTLLVLAAQYESWTDPLAVVLAMPVAVMGTLLGCICMGQSISIYTQIGLILLLGMSAKNAILIVEYAMDFRKGGMDIGKAAQQAGEIRLRPIMMTALAFIFGVLPMMFASGAGANSRIYLGTAIVFGMSLNALVGPTFVPVFWKILQTFNEKYLSNLFPDKKFTAPVATRKGTADAQ